MDEKKLKQLDDGNISNDENNFSHSVPTVPTVQHKTDKLPTIYSKALKSPEDFLFFKDVKNKTAFQKYISDIQKYKLLSREQELELSRALRETEDVEIAKKLVLANLRLVVKIAFEYKNAWHNIMDLIQEGNIGLMKAVSKYDPENGAKLSYYASWWIKSYILKFILDNFRLVKIGTSNQQKKLFYNLVKEKNRLRSLGIDPTDKIVAKNLDVSEKSVKEMILRVEGGSDEVSIDKYHNDSESSSTNLLEILPSSENVEESVSSQQNIDILKSNLDGFIKGLKARDQEIFKKRLLSETPQTLQQIATDLGVSRERIRQIEVRLINHLKVYMSEYIR